MNKLSRNFKATILFGLSSFITSGLNYVFTPIFTRILSQSEYGQISIYNSTFAILSVIATLCLDRPGVTSVGMYEYKEKRFWYIKNISCLIITIGTLLFALLYLNYQLFSTYINISRKLLLLMYLSCITQPANALWLSKEKFEYNYKNVSLVTISAALISQVISVLCVYYFSNSNLNLAEVRLISAGIINILISIGIYIYIFINGKGNSDLSIYKNAIKFTLPLIPHYLGFSLLNGIDKIMIGNMVGNDKTAIYSLAATISNIGMLIWNALNVSITPFVYKNLDKKNYEIINKKVMPLLILSGLGCICVTLISPEVILIFGSKKYLEGIYVMPSIIAGLFMHIVYSLFSTVAFFNKKSINIAISTFVAALSNVILNIIFINKYGYIAAGYTTFISFLILAVLHIINSILIEKKSIINLKDLVLVVIFVVTACFLCNLIFDFVIIRYLLFITILIIIIIKRNYFIEAISSMEV